jgi:hypothetical protein
MKPPEVGANFWLFFNIMHMLLLEIISSYVKSRLHDVIKHYFESAKEQMLINFFVWSMKPEVRTYVIFSKEFVGSQMSYR